jgi:hypothetical protein
MTMLHIPTILMGRAALLFAARIIRIDTRMPLVSAVAFGDLVAKLDDGGRGAPF